MPRLMSKRTGGSGTAAASEEEEEESVVAALSGVVTGAASELCDRLENASDVVGKARSVKSTSTEQ